MRENDRKKTSVLILECDKDLGSSIKTYLEDSFRVFSTCNPDEIDRLISQNQIDILLTGIDFPRMNLKSIMERARQVSPKIKVVVMYMFFDTDRWTEKLILSNADDYIAKPFDADVLKHKLDRLMAGERPLKNSGQLFH